MNASPHFRYYAALVLILMLALMLRVPAHAEPVAQSDRGGIASWATAGAKLLNF